MDEKSYQVDNLLTALGAKGTYQIIQMIVSLSPTLCAALQLLANVFTCQNIPHRCAAPPNGSEFFDQWTSYTNVTYEYQKCNIVVKDNGTTLATETCIYGMEYPEGKDASAMSQFDLVCERESLAKLSQTLVICGQGIGAVLTTMVSDKIGRKVVLVGANVGLLVCGLVIAYAPNYAIFAIFKFIVGGFQQGILTGTFTFNAELFPTEARHFNAVFCSLAWGLSAMTLPLLSYFSRDYSWRITQTIFCSAGVTLLLQILFMDESIRWLLANGKSKRAIRVIRGAAKMNSRNFEEVMLSYKNDTSSSTNLMTTTFDSDQEIAQNTRKMSLLDILRIPRLLRNALSIWFAWFTTALGFFAIYLTTTSLSGNPYLNFFLTATMEIPPAIIFYFTLNRLGRRISAMIPFMLLAIGLLMVGILQSFGPNSNTDIPIMIFQMIGMCGASGCFGAVFSYTPEMFPTNVRLDSIHFSVAFGATLGIYSSNVYNGDHRSTAPIVTYSRCLTS